MKTQEARIISIYAADTSGVCSMLYELGGMTVVHDASGCNSTYSTFDEPRWYRRNSMIYISALTETDAILGNDEKLIADLTAAANDLAPRFIALCGAPVAMMTGADFDAVAAEAERRTGIPAFSVHTTGTHSYLAGASGALLALLARFVRRNEPKTAKLSANIVGATPLDFSIAGMADSMKTWLHDNNIELVSCLAMGSTLDAVMNAGQAQVNLVVSYAGLATAQWLEAAFHTPFVAGVPCGKEFSARLAGELKQAAADGQNRFPCADRGVTAPGGTVVAGESIFAGSLAKALELQNGEPVRVLCPLETDASLLLAPGDVLIPDEDDAEREFRLASGVIADPLYRPVCPANVPFRALPHEAFSGRCYRKLQQDFIAKKIGWRK